MRSIVTGDMLTERGRGIGSARSCLGDPIPFNILGFDGI
jgi:hypothetical protein